MNLITFPNLLSRPLGVRGAGGDTTAPTLVISALSAVGNVVAMQIVASEEVTGFTVDDLTISAGSLDNFASSDNITFTVDWTLAEGVNTMDIAEGVCQDAAGNENTAATQYAMTYLVLQPAAAAADDAYIFSTLPTRNYGVSTVIVPGAGNSRGLIKFDLSSIPAGSTVLSSIISLYEISEAATGDTTIRIFRLKRAWVEGTRNDADDSPATGVTWNRYDTTNNWQTAGGFGANDCEQTDIGSRSFSATETTSQFKDFTLTASKVQEMITDGAFVNNGFLIKNDIESGTQHNFASSDNATAGKRPKFAVVYHP